MRNLHCSSTKLCAGTMFGAGQLTNVPGSRNNYVQLVRYSVLIQ